MEKILNYDQIPEYQEGEKAMDNLRIAADKCKNQKEKIAMTALVTMQETVKEIDALQVKLQETESLISARKLRGESSTKDEKVIEDLISRISRLKFSIDSFTKMKIYIEIELQKKVDNLLFEKSETESMLKRWNEDYSTSAKTKNGAVIHSKEKLAKKCKVIDELTDRLKSINSELINLKECFKTLKKLAPDDKIKHPIADPILTSDIEKCQKLAVEVYKKRSTLRKALVDKLEKSREEIEKLRTENVQLEIAISSLNPDSVADILQSADICSLIYPVMHTDAENRFFEGNKLSFIRHKIFSSAV
jgi:hypothetical protein